MHTLENCGAVNVNPKQVIAGIDEVFNDFSNKQIEIRNVVGLVSLKIRGEIDKEAFEKELQRLRQVYTKK